MVLTSLFYLLKIVFFYLKQNNAKMKNEITTDGENASAKAAKETAGKNSKYILLNKSTIHNPPYNVDISKKLLCVEYPGIVENIDKAIETLGGIRAIETAVGNYNRRLELKYRPNDVFSKPCWGEKDYSSGILVKIKVSRPKTNNDVASSSTSNENTNETATTYQYEVLGTTAMTFKFSRLCDFQYIPLLPTTKKKENANTPCQYVYEDIMPKKLPTWEWFLSKESVSMPSFFTPPIFTRFNTSKDNKLYFERYKYYESLIPEFAEKLKKDAQKKNPIPKNIITRSRSERKVHSVFINPLAKDAVIPTGPTKEAIDNLQRLALDGPPFETIQELFSKRPIWSKAALSHQTGIRYDRLKYLLPCVGYHFTSGPWRIMWCRFGFDPRNEPSARIYQTFDFRIRTSDGLKVKIQPKKSFSNIMHYKAGRITSEKFSLKDCSVQKTSPKPIPTEDHYILKPDMLPAARQMFYQYCDLHIPEIQDMLNRLPERSVYAAKDGWLPNGFGDQCREIANRYITKHVKTLLLEDKRKVDADKSISKSDEGIISGEPSTGERNLSSPIIILDDDEDENFSSKDESDGENDNVMYSDDEIDLQNMEIENTDDINMEAIDEINTILSNVSTTEAAAGNKELSDDDDLPTELQDLYRKLVVSGSNNI